jgi:hypothetical protein
MDYETIRLVIAVLQLLLALLEILDKLLNK